jgi:uncharacterized protein YbjT (DUF2867 family)
MHIGSSLPGWTGTIGTEVVRILAERGERVRAMTRNPEGANLPAEVVRGDFDDRDSLDGAVAGAAAVFLLDAPGPWIERHDLAMLDAVRSHGVGKVVKPVANLTGNGAQGVIDPCDIAEVAVAALTTPDHAGRTYTLTGPELLSAPDQVEVLRKVLGRTARTYATWADNHRAAFA